MKRNVAFIFVLVFIFFSRADRLVGQVNPGDLAYDKDVSRRGTSAGAMLEIGIGARAEALGGAFVSIADDPSALYWNPAGIAKISRISLQATKTDWFVGTTFNSVDLVVPAPMISSALGFHVALLDYGTNPVRSIFRPEGTGETYSATDLVAGIYLGMGITDRVNVGIGLKYFQETIWHVKGSVMAVDLSILFDTPLNGLRLGAALSNLGPDFNLSGRDMMRVIDVDGRKETYFNNDNVPIMLATEDYPLPLLFRFGLSYNLEFGPNSSLLLASNVNHPSNDDESADIGAELKLLNVAFLRAGYHSLFNETAVNGLTLGAGLNYKIKGFAAVTLDYAWSDWTILASVHRFTVGISAY